MTEKSSSLKQTDHQLLCRRHLRIGWWSLLLFLTLGIILESLHGFKIQWYVSVSNETRRLMFTLAHSHGTLLALVHLAFAFTLTQLHIADSKKIKLASVGLTGAGFLMPAGFLLGGAFHYSGDPGLGILLLPLGALLLLIAVLAISLEVIK